ncbi:unnamed protein product [Discosporangium mesarthrocarpum]
MAVTRCLLQESGLPSVLWPETFATTTYIGNLVPTSSLAGGTPYAAWFGSPASLAQLRVWGARAFVHKERPQPGGKLCNRAWEGCLVQYGEESRTYGIWQRGTRTIVFTRNQEEKEQQEEEEQQEQEQQEEQKSQEHVQEQVDHPQQLAQDPAPLNPRQQRELARLAGYNNPPAAANMFNLVRDMNNLELLDLHYKDDLAPRFASAYAVQQLPTGGEPTTYAQALASPDADKWVKVINDEYSSLMEQNTWDPVLLPPGRKLWAHAGSSGSKPTAVTRPALWPRDSPKSLEWITLPPLHLCHA